MLLPVSFVHILITLVPFPVDASAAACPHPNVISRPQNVTVNYLNQGLRPPEHFLLAATQVSTGSLLATQPSKPSDVSTRSLYPACGSKRMQQGQAQIHAAAAASTASTCCAVCLRLSHLRKHAACSCRPGSRLAALQCTHTGASCEAQPPTTQLLLPDPTAALTTMRGSDVSGKACCQAVKKSGLGCMPAARHNTHSQTVAWGNAGQP